MGKLQGKTALVTGGTTGIGFATAQLFLSEGARVAVLGQDEARVAAAADKLGAGAIAFRADVSSASEMQAAVDRVQAEFGHLDIVFANAGIAMPAPVADADEVNIVEQINVNLKGVIYTVQKTLPILRRPGSIIFTSTTLAEQGVANLGVYSATKAAIRSLARTLSTELKDRGIRVNVVSPGLIETPIYGKLGMTPDAVNAWASTLLGTVPAARFGNSEEIAKAVLFLASDDSSYVLGENLLVDGGMASV